MEVNTGTESTLEKNCPCMGVAALLAAVNEFGGWGLGVGGWANGFSSS